MSTPEEITRNADDDPDCRRAVVRFCEMLGALAGDLALVFGAWDGVYLSGGLAQPLERWLAAEGFRRSFEDKGRFARSLARVPTSLVLHEDPGLLGAAAFARIEFGRSASGTR
jgi:glucokinase